MFNTLLALALALGGTCHGGAVASNNTVCGWHAGNMGNGKGTSFVAVGQHVVYGQRY